MSLPLSRVLPLVAFYLEHVLTKFHIRVIERASAKIDDRDPQLLAEPIGTVRGSLTRTISRPAMRAASLPALHGLSGKSAGTAATACPTAAPRKASVSLA